MEAILRHLCQIHDLNCVSVQFNTENEPSYGVSVFIHFEAEGCEAGSGATFDEAFAAAMKKVTDERDNAAEAAWQSHQEALMESGGPDNSQFRTAMAEAGRAHLVK